MDDLIILVNSYHLCLQHLEDTIRLLQNLGLVHIWQEVIIPPQAEEGLPGIHN